MENNFEKIFKEKFDSFEAEYDQSAWNSLENRLGNSAQGGGSSSLMYWAAALLGVVAVTTALVYFYNDNNTDTNLSAQQVDKIVEPEEETAVLINDDDATRTEKLDEKPATISNENHKENVSTTIAESSSTSKTVNELSSEKNTTTTIDKEQETLETNKDNISEQKQAAPISDTNRINELKSISLPDTDAIESSPKKTAKRRFISGVVEQHTTEENTIYLCAGEPLVVKNPSKDQETVRVAYNNQEIDIPAGQFTQLTLTNSSTISFLNEENEVIHQQDIEVSSSPQIDFTYEANIYEEGLPVVKLESYGSYENTSWTINGEQVLTSPNPTVHLYTKGEYEVELNITDDNGCATKKSRTIKIDKDYNLMAVSAFRPNDSDPRNRTFMPFSLTQRPVQFVLTIIDPKDNGIVFKSKDASQPWDGTDQRTGKMTPPEKTYMWKVQLENPLPNERSVYVGTVVHH